MKKKVLLVLTCFILLVICFFFIYKKKTNPNFVEKQTQEESLNGAVVYNENTHTYIINKSDGTSLEVSEDNYTSIYEVDSDYNPRFPDINE
ncbi:MAG: hypothetical protein IJ867_01845 [Clostridia bacterium]|nr:hypothetical protein [Clostridia bacterium]